MYVVLSRATGQLKVGVANDVTYRIRSLRRHVPGFDGEDRLDLVGCWAGNALEVHLLARLHPWLLEGEWFVADEDSLALISAWRKRLPRSVKVSQVVLDGTVKRGGVLRMWLAVYYAARATNASSTASRLLANRWLERHSTRRTGLDCRRLGGRR